jgi:hypothetical protein
MLPFAGAGIAEAMLIGATIAYGVKVGAEWPKLER